MRRANVMHGTTAFMTLMSAYAILLARYSRQHDLVIGISVNDRPDPQLEHVAGFFVNTLAIRAIVRPEQSCRDVLATMRRTILDAYDHQAVPFEQIVDCVARPADAGRKELFHTTLAFVNVPAEPMRLRGLDIEPIDDPEPHARYDLDLSFVDQGDTLDVSWVYSRDLFDRWRIEQMAAHYTRVLDAIVSAPDRAVGDIELLSPEERRALLDG